MKMIFRPDPNVSNEEQRRFYESDEMQRWAAYVKDWIYTRRPERVTRDDIQVAALWSVKDFHEFYRKSRIILDYLVYTGHLKRTKWRDDGFITVFREGFFTEEMERGHPE